MDTPMQSDGSMGGDQMPPVAPAPNPTGGDDPKAKAMGMVSQFEAWLESVMVTKAPFQIPMGGKEFIATVAPYLVIIGAVLFALSLPALFGLGMLGGAVGMMGGSVWGFSVIVSLATGAVAVVIELMALSGLFKRTARSWRLVYYATLVSFAGNILSLNIIGAIIGGIIGWYLLFQVKAVYKN